MKQRNILGILSLLAVLVNIIFFFLLNSPEANVTLGVVIFVSFSILGVLFAIFSKRIEFMIISIPLNLGIALVALFLLLSLGIGEA